MYRPLYGPPETFSTGAAGPNPSMPSLTIVPFVTATSITFDPQALPMVPMSTPWSSVHCEGETTRDFGCSGNTQPLGAPEEAVRVTFRRADTHAVRVAAVCRPTVPLGGVR